MYKNDDQHEPQEDIADYFIICLLCVIYAVVAFKFDFWWLFKTMGLSSGAAFIYGFMLTIIRK